MKKSKPLLIAALGFALILPPLHAQVAGDKIPGVTKGPATAKLGAIAHIEVPADCVFLDGEATRRRVKSAGNRVSGNEVGLISPTNHLWAVYFEYDASGHVLDDEKDKLDSMADKILASYKEGAAQQNKERERMGAPAIEIVGWLQPPHYDETTHNLTWAIRATSGGQPLLNYNTRLLGRLGSMEVVLACDPDQLPQTLPAFTSLLAGYSFQSGQTYAEYRPGDKVAKYGLAALVVGGAAVGAAKLGLLAWLLPFLKKGWILIVAAFAAVANFFKKTFAKISGRKPDDQSPQ